ncbi:hypothetical protein EIN_424280 [Entamoeba invadens IP1]|uniref:Uncharacterized protein n=1 Tax=Entamoeba invadens IP1 TaxID=370355 RepID=A0A0A1U976_ENTIV|nr:hypothetical protein EIN_424280 [Entamoeba invadens IP1]ELP89746.1 hypothetical protein EIN_424280 [Entamoeba invadens IP1]|eukprot:XP_004256517.1 hypothetical protein EIN_424280 [Entamoeba invadens IP1]
MTSNKFYITLDAEENTVFMKKQDGVLMTDSSQNKTRSVFEVERVDDPPLGFYLKSGGTYFYRCKHGPLIVASEKSKADIFEYDFETKLLVVVRPEGKFVCSFRDDVLFGDDILKIDFSTTYPSVEIGGSSFFFLISSLPSNRSAFGLFLSPISTQANVVLRQGKYGEETFVCMKDMESERKMFLSRNKTELNVTIFKENAEKFTVKDKTPFFWVNRKFLPLIAGEQSVKGYQVAFPLNFFNFHPL